MATLSDPQEQALKSALIQKATRFLVMSGAPLGRWGNSNEIGLSQIRPDYEVAEMLLGLRGQDWDVDLETLVSTDEVIRVGLQTEPGDYPLESLPDVERAISAACSWVASYLIGVGLA